MDISCKFDVTRDDIYKVTKYYYSKSGRQWVWRAVGVGCLLLGVASIAVGGEWVWGMVLLAYAAFVCMIPTINAFFGARTYFSNPNLGGSVEYRMTDDRMDSRSSVGESTLEWKLFTKWAESPEAFLLIIHKNRYVLAIKRGFEGEAEIGQFREFLTARIGKRSF